MQADFAVSFLFEALARRHMMTLHKSISTILADSPTQPMLYLLGFLNALEGGCMRTNGKLGFVFLTSEMRLSRLTSRSAGHQCCEPVI